MINFSTLFSFGEGGKNAKTRESPFSAESRELMISTRFQLTKNALITFIFRLNVLMRFMNVISCYYLIPAGIIYHVGDLLFIVVHWIVVFGFSYLSFIIYSLLY